MKKLYVIIVTYFAEKWIDKFMQSIENSTIKTNVIIVDNASKDKTIDIIKSKYQNVDLIESKENLGFGAANNLAIKKAIDNGADYVFLLNQDAWLESDCFEKLINFAENNKEYGIISPIQANPNKEKSLEDLFTLFLTRDGDRQQIISDFFYNNIQDYYNVDFVQAAGWLLSKKCIQEVGLFDPLFFHYGEDSDYAKRVLRHNLKIGIVTNAIMYHAAEHFSPKVVTKKYLYKKELNSSYSWWIGCYKNYDGNFFVHILEITVDFNAMIFKDLLHLNLKGALMKTHLYLKLIFKTRKVIKSRKTYY
ncbi:MAG: glycosyltransferase family 2 protein [Bacteroidales bacterium]|nr:glycosyltransferase family 2 protein [Bacteroidales bacterium]